MLPGAGRFIFMACGQAALLGVAGATRERALALRRGARRV